jgi:WD40 repeat protein
MQIPATTPLVGPLLARHRAGKAARAALGGDDAAIRQLCQILVETDDGFLQETARSALGSLSQQGAIDTFCGAVLGAGDLHPRLVEIAVRRNYAPSAIPARALFYAATGRKGSLDLIDTGPFYLHLARGYRLADPLTRRRILLAAAQDTGGWCSVLARAFLGDPAVRDPGAWSRAEWEIIITGFIAEQDRDTLWSLLFSAPPSLAVRSLHFLNAGTWMPPAVDRNLFTGLVAALPPGWDYPLPPKPIQLSLANPDRQCLKMIFSPEGSVLAASHADGAISVWQTASGRLLASWSEGSGISGEHILLTDSGGLISLSEGGILRCRNIQDGTVRWIHDDPLHRITKTALSVNGEYLMAGDTGGCVSRLDCRSGKNGGEEFPAYPSPVTAVIGTPDGTCIACGHEDGTIRCRDRRTPVYERISSGSATRIRTLAFSDDGALLFVLPGHAQPFIQDVPTGKRVLTCTGFPGVPVDHAISTAGRVTLLVDTNNTLWPWRWNEPRLSAGTPFYNRHPGCCDITPDGSLCIAGCDDGTIRIFASRDGRLLRDFRGHTRPVSACAVSPDNSLLATASWDGTVTLRNLPSGEIRRTLQRQAGPVTAFGMTPEGRILIAATDDGIARLYSRDEGTLIRSIDLYTPSARSIAVSPDGKYLACAGSDATLRLWNLATGSLAAGRERLGTTLRSLAFSPDSSLLVSGGWDGKVRYWQVPDLHPAGTGKGHTSIVSCCAVTPDGTHVVTGSNDTTVRIWQLKAGKSSVVIRDARTEVRACTILPDGSVAVTGSADGSIRLYRLPDGKCEGSIPAVPGTITTLACSPDGELCIAGYKNGTLAFCSIPERRLIRILPAHTAAISGIALVPGGEYAVTGGMDGVIRVTRLPWTKSLAHATLDDLPLVYDETTGDPGDTGAQWTFLYRLLAGRFRGEIGICPPSSDAEPFDIQIAG